MHGSASLDRQSIQCGRDLLWATPRLQLLLEHGLGSDGTMNAPFDHPFHDAGQPKLHVQHLAYLPQTSTTVRKPRLPSGYGRYDRS
jgi:hypothetical protein